MKHGRGEYSVTNSIASGSEVKKTDATRNGTTAINAAKEYFAENGYEVDSSGRVRCSLATANDAFEHALVIGGKVPRPKPVSSRISQVSARRAKK